MAPDGLSSPRRSLLSREFQRDELNGLESNDCFSRGVSRESIAEGKPGVEAVLLLVLLMHRGKDLVVLT